MDETQGLDTQVTYKGRKIPIQIAKGDVLGNGWMAYAVRSLDAGFIDTFGATEVQLSVKPELPCTPENDPDYERRTPEQTILVKEIWDCICNQTPR